MGDPHVSKTKEEIRERTIEVIHEQLAVEKNKVTDEVTLLELGMDSLDLVELVMDLEDEFDINIPDEAAEKFSTVKDVLGYVQKHAR